MIIKDPQNLLDLNAIPDRECLSGMILEIPSHGVPIHPTSINRFLEEAKVGQQLLMLQPKLPVSSQLGLPPYPILAYLYPQSLSQKLTPFFQNLSILTSGSISLSSTFTVIDQIDTEEALHYFAKYYGKAIKPAFIRAIIGNTCNLKCVMCPHHSNEIKPTHKTDFFQVNRAMTWDMLERLARDSGDLKAKVLIGGIEEPLLHPEIYSFIRLCRQEGVPQVHIITNGQLLNSERSRLLLKAGITSLDISLDAVDPETYYRIRGSDLHRVEANIDKFLDLRDTLGVSCPVRTSLIRNPEISPEMEALFKQKWLEKVDGVSVINIAEYQEKNMRLCQTNKQVEALVQYYMQQSNGRWPCTFPFTEMDVLPDGRVYYCIETRFRLGFEEAKTMGDYCTQSLLDVWQGEAFQQLRNDLILNQLDGNSPCQDCEMWRSQAVFHSHQRGVLRLSTEASDIYHKLSI